MLDKLIVKGVDATIDGEYECDLGELLEPGGPNSITSREGHRIKLLTGLRAGEIGEAFETGDTDILVALAAIILGRHGKQFADDTLWDAPIGYITFDVGKRPEADDAGPPEVKSGDDAKPLTDAASANGGESSKSGSVYRPESDPKLTGALASERSVT